jgi:predicted nucleotide-binding protein
MNKSSIDTIIQYLGVRISKLNTIQYTFEQYSDDESLFRHYSKIDRWIRNTKAAILPLFQDKLLEEEFETILSDLPDFDEGLILDEIVNDFRDELDDFIERIQLHASTLQEKTPGLRLDIDAGPSVSNARDPFDKRKVFIVHGHDEALKQKVARFLEKLNLEPIILHEQASMGKTIIEKFEHYSDVAFAVILLTADDFGGAKNSKTQNHRARQNVVFEFGYCVGKLGRNKFCALVEDGVEQPSDINGVVYVSIDEGGAWKQKLAQEMKSVGLTVDMNKLIN